jgi:hypothetical protein
MFSFFAVLLLLGAIILVIRILHLVDLCDGRINGGITGILF